MRTVRRIISLVLITVMVLSLDCIASSASNNKDFVFIAKEDTNAIKDSTHDKIKDNDINLDKIMKGHLKVGAGGDIPSLRGKLKDGTLLGNDFKMYSDIDENGSKTFNLSIKKKNRDEEFRLSGSAYKNANNNGTLKWDGPRFSMPSILTGFTVEMRVAAYDDESKWPQGERDPNHDVLVNGVPLIYNMFEQLFPVGTELICKVPPKLGTWEKVTIDKGRALWLETGNAWGTTIAQSLPDPGWKMDANDGKHTHTFTGTSNTTSTDGAHTHTQVGYKKHNWYTTGSYAMTAREITLTGDAGTSSHRHSFTPTGTVGTTGAAHTHATNWQSSSKYYGSKVQPAAYCVEIWKRTA